MGSRYLFIVLHVFLEHHLTRGDYRLDRVRQGRWRAGTPGAMAPPDPLRADRDTVR